MNWIILNKELEGPFLKTDELEESPGVYIVMCDAYGISPVRILNAGESENVKASLGAKKKKNFLGKSKNKTLKFLISYEKNHGERIRFLKDVKKFFTPSL